MSKQFKVEYRRWGVKYAPHYLSSVAGAVAKAKARGFDETHDSWSTTPDHAIIFERDGEDWEPIATVNGNGITVANHAERASVKRDQNQILQAKNRITAAEQLQKHMERFASNTECATTAN